MSQIKLADMGVLSIEILISSIEGAINLTQYQLKTIVKNPFYQKKWLVNWGEFYEIVGKSNNVIGAKIALLPISEGITLYVCNLADGWPSLYENIIKNASRMHIFFEPHFPLELSIVSLRWLCGKLGFAIAMCASYGMKMVGNSLVGGMFCHSRILKNIRSEKLDHASIWKRYSLIHAVLVLIF